MARNHWQIAHEIAEITRGLLMRAGNKRQMIGAEHHDLRLDTWLSEVEKRDRGWQSSPTVLVILYLLLSTVWSTGVKAQVGVECNKLRLEQAENAYTFGIFGQTFDLLRPCLPDGYPEKAQRVAVCRLMALSYIATDSLDRAVEWVRLLLRADSRYKTNEQVDPLVFTDMVNRMKPRWYTWLWRGNEWYKWVGRGLVTGAAVSITLILKGNPEPDLPDPPDFPIN